MIRFLLRQLLVGGFSVCGLLGIVSASERSLRVATYNLNNYLVMNRTVDSVWRPAYPKPEAEKAIVRAVIQNAMPDVLAVQEVGTLSFLEELRSDLALEGLQYPYIIHMQGADEVRHLAVLSKIPPIEVVKHRDLDFKYQDGREFVSRGLLELTFADSKDDVFKLFVVHLKSRWSDVKADPESQLRRTREAEVCRDRIIERTVDMGMTDFLIAGDFNDHRGSAPMRRFAARGEFQISSLVSAEDSRGEQWTYFYHKHVVYSLVDGLMVSPSLRPHVQGGAGRIVDIPDALSGSDHRMVYLDLEAR